ncbi:GIY-YIG nuclease family protein [Patescibacteria group bacterium]|nr:GIY-YIG nuclease family protein [Patescibacteria group bacterium]
MKGFRFIKKGETKKLPKAPGVYCFLNRRRKLYIGKAANIQERIKNHFQQPGFKEDLFLNQTKKIGFLKTDSGIEALILEANLIKKHQPKYNVIWRDDKNFFYTGITKEDFPRVFWTHQIKLQTTNYKLQTKFIGPFVEGRALKQTLKILRKVFPYRSCKNLPKRPCLWYQLDRCPAPCLLKSKLSQQIPQVFYQIKNECQRNVKSLKKILQGKKIQVLKDLKKEMKKVAKEKKFEKAAKIRDQIRALRKILSHTRLPVSEAVGFDRQAKIFEWRNTEKNLKKLLKIKRGIKRIEAYDVSGFQGNLATGSMVVFINGEPDKNFYRKFKIKITGKSNDLAMIREILFRRFQHPEWGRPDLILIDGGKTQLKAARSETKNIKVIALAKKGNKLYIENQKKPILLKNLSREIFNLILQLRDEAHRFAISYHRKLRKKRFLG